MDAFLISLEATAFSTWMRESPSMFAFPAILAVHTIGLAFLAGLNAALDLRLLGFAVGVPTSEFRRFVPLMWVGLWLNVISGLALLLGYPTKALTNPVFYVKLGFIAAALVILKIIRQRALVEVRAPSRLKALAVASLFCWAAAITAGRLLAYTYSRLMAGE